MLDTRLPPCHCWIGRHPLRSQNKIRSMPHKLFCLPLLSLVTWSFASLGCSAGENGKQCFSLALDRPMLILESDWANASALGRMEADGCYTELADISLGADPDLAFSGGRPFVSIRDKGVVLEIDTSTLRATQTFAIPTADGSAPNPQDVAVAPSGDLLVTRYNTDSVALLQPDGSLRREISLASVSDPDGIPEMTAVRVLGAQAFVALELLPRPELTPANVPGAIAVIDLNDLDAAVESFALHAKNPFGHLIPVLDDPSGSTVSMAMPGDIHAISATDGIEVIHLDTRESELIIDENALGGSAVEAVIAGPEEGYAIVGGPVAGVNPTKVVQFDPSRGVVTRTLSGPAEGFFHGGLAINGDHLVFGDGTPGAPKIVFIDRKSGNETLVIEPRLMRPISMMTLP
jgi:hypothetical protein